MIASCNLQAVDADGTVLPPFSAAQHSVCCRAVPTQNSPTVKKTLGGEDEPRSLGDKDGFGELLTSQPWQGPLSLSRPFMERSFYGLNTHYFVLLLKNPVRIDALNAAHVGAVRGSARAPLQLKHVGERVTLN